MSSIAQSCLEVKNLQARITTITERGRPIGRIVPLARSTKAQLEALSQVGLIFWNGERLPPLAPVVRVTGGRTLADLLLEDRG